MHTDAWLAAACADADRRGLPQLKALLETLAKSQAALRCAAAAEPDGDAPSASLPGPRS
jgi:hypothetical protein